MYAAACVFWVICYLTYRYCLHYTYIQSLIVGGGGVGPPLVLLRGPVARLPQFLLVTPGEEFPLRLVSGNRNCLSQNLVVVGLTTTHCGQNLDTHKGLTSKQSAKRAILFLYKR